MQSKASQSPNKRQPPQTHQSTCQYISEPQTLFAILSFSFMNVLYAQPTVAQHGGFKGSTAKLTYRSRTIFDYPTQLLRTLISRPIRSSTLQAFFFNTHCAVEWLGGIIVRIPRITEEYLSPNSNAASQNMHCKIAAKAAALAETPQEGAVHNCGLS